MRCSSFLKHAGVYALGDVLMMAGGFVLLPLYTRCLRVGEFGVLEMLERFSEIAAVCLIARGLPLATLTFYRQSQTRSEQARVVGAAVVLGGCTMLAGVLLLWLSGDALTALLHLDHGLLLWAALVAALLDGLCVVGLAVHQARMESGVYVAVSCGQFLLKVALCLLFVLCFEWGVAGILAASLVRSVCFAGALLGWEWRLGIAWPDGATLRAMLQFTLPFVPTGLCFFVLNSADRFFLLHWRGQDEVGVYGLGYRLAQLVGFLSLTPLFRVWSARMYDVAAMPEAAAIFGRVASGILGGYLFVGLGLCLLQDEIIRTLAGDAFAPAASIMPLIVLAYWFQAASVLADASFYVRRRTGWKPWIALASTAVMLVLYVVLIPAWGMTGAALATLGGFAFHAVLTQRVAQRVFAVRHEKVRLLGMLGAAAALWLASRTLGSGLTVIPIKLALWLLWPASLWFFGLIAPDEKQAVLELLRPLLPRRALAKVAQPQG